MVRFELFEVHVQDCDPFMSNGLDVKDKDDVQRVTYGGSHEVIDFIWGEHTVDFTITNPKDTMALYNARQACRESRTTFSIVCFSYDLNGELIPIHQLDGCIFVEGDRQMTAKKEIVPNFTGFAMRSQVLETQY